MLPRVFLILCFFLLLISAPSLAQNYKGYNSVKNAGVYATPMQPARILDLKQKWNFNVLGSDLNLIIGGDATPSDETLSSIGNGDLLKLAFTESADAIFYTRTMFPGLIYKFNKRFAIGFIPQMRAIALGRYRNPDFKGFMQGIMEKQQQSGSYSSSTTAEFATVFIHSWIDFKFPVAYELYNDGKNRLQVGGALSILSGNSSGIFEVNGVEVQRSGSDSFSLNGSFSFRFDNSFDRVVSENQFQFDLFKHTGIGGDIGLRYSYFRSNEESVSNDYLFDVGVSLIDLGSISYKPSENSIDIDFGRNTLNLNFLNSGPGISSLVDTLKERDLDFSEEPDNIVANLPTQLVLHGDLNVYKDFFLNMQFNYWLRSFTSFDSNKNYYEYTIIPRFDNDKFGVTAPYIIRNGLKNSFGISFNYKGYFIGSSNLWTGLFSESERDYLNVYFGAAFSLKSKPQD